MTARNEPRDRQDAGTDDSKPGEVNNLREARKLFIGVILTPIYWFVMSSIAMWWEGEDALDTTWIAVLWGVMGLILTVSMTVGGVMQSRAIRASEDQRGLFYALGTVIVGAFFTVATVAITVGLVSG